MKMINLMTITLLIIFGTNAYADSLSGTNGLISVSPNALTTNTSANNVASTINNTNPLIKQPDIAVPSVYGQDNKSSPEAASDVKDVLIQPVKSEIGGSQHQEQEIKNYLGIGY